ncbi:glycosyltransferase family 39 protein [Ancylothrix sp. C2]|uniref:glycosyltransferase family 39 protein n=1 Tax=Ancylothrix sp. D3o TaxID=2953691 RepID=UPI0021BB0243|nr:glycosyltransferase family 39 protein [Ancylothrix sp. D3o]MCT7951024.1 glycosyltransferase family 39 protein [Ancylothrix sp. D3o]
MVRFAVLGRLLKGGNFRDFLILGLVWLVCGLHDRLWFALDRSVPAWDQAENLTGALNYWNALLHPNWFSAGWWRDFWMLSSKMPPLTYILTAIFHLIFGTGPQQATLVYLFFSGVLLGSVYGLGRVLFDGRVGLWAAGLCVLFPGLVRLRLEFLLDYPLTAMVALTFFCLTLWRGCFGDWLGLGAGTSSRAIAGNFIRFFNYQSAVRNPEAWVFASLFGLCFGLALLVKQTALFFVLIPLLWVGVGVLWHRQWGRFFQLLWSLFLTLLVCGPWYRTNWLLILTSGKRATVDSAFAEGDPALNTLGAWLFYGQDLPNLLSWPLLLVPVVGFLLFVIKLLFRNAEFSNNLKEKRKEKAENTKKSLIWLLVFLVGSYLLCSLNVNKDSRYVLPYLPVVALFLAYGLMLYPRRWGRRVRWGTVVLGVVLMLLNVWPVGGFVGRNFVNFLSPRGEHLAYFGAKWPHQEVISEIINYSPFLEANLGVLPSTPEINQHNFNYFGALESFQVYARQVGVRVKDVGRDAGSMSWFVTKTGDQGSVPKQAQAAIVKLVEDGGDFVLHKRWRLPDRSVLKLYRRRVDFVDVEVVKNESVSGGVRLASVRVPDVVLPGLPVPVSYEWLGSWDELQKGIVLLSWKQVVSGSKENLSFLHDHAIGLGMLHDKAKVSKSEVFLVRENLAMLPPPNSRGVYVLEGRFLNRQTGKSYAVNVPNVRLRVDAKAARVEAPELDLVTQMRVMAVSLRLGVAGLGPIFEEVARINQYDPVQDYTMAGDLALSYRLRNEGAKRSWAYAVGFSRVLRQDVRGAIRGLEEVVRLDSENVYAYGYLAFVHLYNWDGRRAERALKPAFDVDANVVEIKALRGVARLMQGNFLGAWGDLQVLRGLGGG